MQFYRDTNNTEAYNFACEQVEATYPTDKFYIAQRSDDLILMGNAFFQQGKYQDAIHYYDLILNNYKPEWYNPVYNKALSLEMLGRQAEAIKFYEKIPSHDENYPKAVQRLTGIYTNTGNTMGLQRLKQAQFDEKDYNALILKTQEAQKNQNPQ